MTNTEAWVGLGVAVGKMYMEAILNCRVPRTVDTIWDTTYKLKTGGAADSKELSAKDVKGDK